jgi:hypothetical protein
MAVAIDASLVEDRFDLVGKVNLVRRGGRQHPHLFGRHFGVAGQGQEQAGAQQNMVNGCSHAALENSTGGAVGTTIYILKKG